MVKKIIAGALVAFTLLVAGTALAQTGTTTSTTVNNYIAQLNILRQLRQGMTGEDVTLLQTILATQPDLYPEGMVTGYYGALTSKAVAKFQKKYGIAAIGQVGPMTRNKLNEFFSTSLITSELSNGTTTACVSLPPGHLIAPGQIKKRGGQPLVISPCQKLPPGIAKKLGLGSTTPPGTGTTTPPIGTTTPAAPSISSVMATSTASTTATVSWMTNQPATSWVWYGTSTPVLTASSTKTVGNNTLVFSHSLDLMDLMASTTYHYVVYSGNSNGLIATSSEASFMTK
jgi:peptidoglycan hydrolase-like protein with peptidoglycan-binding domain